MTEKPGFDLCQPALVLRLVLAVQGLVIPLVLLLAPQGAWLSRQASVSFAALAATLGWLGLMCLLQPVWAAWPELRRQILALGLGAFLGWLAHRILDSLGLIEPIGGLGRLDLGAAACGALIAAGVWAWLMLRERLRQPAQNQARLAELQARIRPHFLFNALNVVTVLIRLDPERAEKALDDLSALFRQAMAEGNASVSLGNEMDLARRYLAIEQIRFGDRLVLTWDLEAPALKARVPPLVMQPLVENAVKHGVEPSLKGARVHIGAHVTRGLVQVEVSNSLGNHPSASGNGMALANVAERLKLLHDLAAHVESGIVTDPATATRYFVVRMSLPLEA